MPQKQRQRGPSRQEFVEAVDVADRRLTALFSRWADGVLPEIRAEVREIAAPLFRLLERAGLR